MVKVETSRRETRLGFGALCVVVGPAAVHAITGPPWLIVVLAYG